MKQGGGVRSHLTRVLAIHRGGAVQYHRTPTPNPTTPSPYNSPTKTTTQFPRGAAAGTREGSQDAWRARRMIVEAGMDYSRLLAVLGEQNLEKQLDPHNAVRGGLLS